jgi:tetratricopeptide (TPR) repeat protein
VEEIIAALLERGVIVRQNGGLRWAGTAAMEVPATIQDIIRARIDRLEEPVKRTVQAAAVIGREFGLRLLARISEMAQEVQGYLDTLKHLELIHETRFFPELEYIFKHAVTQDVAYQSLLGQRRKELHGAIGQAMEELYADRLEEQAAILAYHYARSEHRDKAVEYALLAGDRATRLYANVEAKTYYEQALTTARALPASPGAQRWEIDAILKLAAVGVTRQDIERDRTNLDRARVLAEGLHDQPRSAQVLYWLGRIDYVLSKPQTAIEYAKQSLEIAERLGDDALAAPPVNLMGRLYWQVSDFPNSSQMLARGVDQMRRLGNKSEEATAAGFAGELFGMMGEFSTAFQYAERGIKVAREIHNPFAEAATNQYRGFVRDQHGDWAQAIEDYENARRIAESAGDIFRVYIVKYYAGQASTMAGDPARGRALLEESLDLAAKIGTKFGLPYQKVYLAGSLLALGELDAISPLCEEAIPLAEEAGDKWIKSLALRTLAEGVSRLDPSNRQEAERAILQAIRIQREIGANSELARTYASYARLLEAWGEKQRAKETLTQAIGMFQEMGMAWDLAQAEQALREV